MQVVAIIFATFIVALWAVALGHEIISFYRNVYRKARYNR